MIVSENDWREEYFLQLRNSVRSSRKKIVVTEKSDPMVIEAICETALDKIANIIIIGDKKVIYKTISELDFHQDLVEVYNPETDCKHFAQLYQQIQKDMGRNISFGEATAIMQDPSFFGAMLLKTGLADGMVCGATSPSSQVLRAALKVGLKSGEKIVSGCMIVLLPSQQWGHNGILVFADVAVIPEPSSEQLVEITRDTLDTALMLTDVDPKVAMISFSTKGSANHQTISKVTDALAMFNQKYPQFIIDGELQVDAAISPEVGKRKAPGSLVAGYANILIFPDLNSANVAVKLVEHVGGAKIMGAIIQGMEKPVNDLSRGSNKEDIKNTIALTALQIIKSQ